MNFITWSSIFNVIVCFGCAGFAYAQNPHSKKHILWSLFSLDVGLWALFYVFWQLSRDAKTALFYVRLLSMFSILMPVLLYHNIVIVTSQTPFYRRLLKWLYGLSFILLLTNLTPAFVKSVSPKMGFPFWPNPGLLFDLDTFNDVIPLGLALYLLWDFRRKSAPGLRNYIAGVVLSMVFGYLAVATNVFLWYDIPVYPFGTAGAAFFIGMMTYLFFKAGFFDLRIFLRDTVNYFLTAVILGSILAFVAWAMERDTIAVILVFFSPFFVPYLYFQFLRLMKKWTRGTWLASGGRYLLSVDTTLEKIKETTYTYNDLARNIITSIMNTFPVQMAAVYFYEVSSRQLILRAQKGMKNPDSGNLTFNRASLAIQDSDPLMSSIQGKKDIVVRETLMIGRDFSESQKSVLQSLERIEAELCAPFLLYGQVKGLLVLGKKRNDAAFNEEDLEAVFTFARMGEEIMRYIIGMETELKNTALYSHDMHHDTRVLLQTMEFLQSPLTKNAAPEKIQSILRQAENVASHLNTIVETNRERSQLIMKSIRGDYELKPVNILPIVKDSCDKYLLTAGKSKIDLKMILPLNAPLILGQIDDLTRVLDNLLNNALRHTPEGGEILVEVRSATEALAIEVKDTGEGIDPSNLEKIWEFGWQDQAAAKKGTSGFGLSIVKQIIELHRGTVAAQSGGKGKGTSFLISLPIAPRPA